ncbi:peptidoglycan DD-metalloendopeptidase family protein [Thermoanaerobacter sp. YS13]|uniref:peptidoglycan DD-metalloendopeptidase family protein n=1 Tax=Thermoanaerobacter sp. YS13 TaxID=1511746 RepID=UPI00068FC0A3|nr:peptidoglycan DD-metalloendopeptidase family protein [Thermoanaerobacter sp. YS13]
MGDYLKNYIKNALKRYIIRNLIRSPHFWIILIFLSLLSFGIFTVLGIFDATYQDSTVAANGKTVQQIMPTLNPPVQSSDRMEEQFFLPWAIPYALQLYARDWNDTLDKDMIVNITKDLNPIFTYFDYDEVTQVWESTKDKNGNWQTKYYEVRTPKKYISYVNTYAGIYEFHYTLQFTENHTESADYKKYTKTFCLTKTGMDFYPDWTRLDAAIAKYAGSKTGNFTVQEYTVEGGQIIKPFDGDYPVTSPFGMREDPKNPNSREFHTGIDFGVPSGTPIKAVADGIVVLAGEYGGYGKAVVIKHANGLSTIYGHLSEIKVEAGKEVKQGEIIGLSGNTGRSTGPHLHFEIRENGQPVDPSLYLTGIKTFSGGEVYYISELNRIMLLETAASFMRNEENIGWLMSSSDSLAKVPNWQKYDIKPGEIPNELIPIFKAAGEKYGIPWTVLAAIAYRESSFNPNAIGPYLPDFNTSAVGMMQFLPETFKAYGVDGDGDGIISPFSPADAVYTAAHYLSANYNLYRGKGYSDIDALRRAIWHYNHAWWYVDQVMSIAEKYSEKYGK